MPRTSKYNWIEIIPYYKANGFKDTIDFFSIPEPTLAKYLKQHPEIPRTTKRKITYLNKQIIKPYNDIHKENKEWFKSRMTAHSTALTDDYPEPDLMVEPEELHSTRKKITLLCNPEADVKMIKSEVALVCTKWISSHKRWKKANCNEPDYLLALHVLNWTKT